MNPNALKGHVAALATAIVGALVGASTTLIGQGVPDPHTQGMVAFTFGAFTWAASVYHRWETSPADVAPDLAGLARQLLPMVDGWLMRLAARAPDGPMAAADMGARAEGQTIVPPAAPCPNCGGLSAAAPKRGA